jgi:drug/metabolite transporter (DMT)-like permease
MDVKTKGTIYLVLCSLIWGGSFLLIKIADETIPPLTFTMSRMAIGATLLYLYLRMRGDDMPRMGRSWIPFGVMGIFGTLLPVLLLAYSEESISSGFAAVLLSIVPVITVVLAHFFGDESLTTAKVIGIAVGLMGAVIVLSPGLMGGVEATIMASMLVLVVALSRASSNVYAREHLSHIAPAKTAAGMMIIATAITLPLAFLIENPVAVKPSTAGIIAVIVSGIFCSAIGYLLLYWLIANRGATFASLIEYIMPVAAVFFSVVFMGAVIQLTTIVGLIILMLCIAIMNGYLGKVPAINAKMP